MYDISLEQSLFSAQSDTLLAPTTFAALLAKNASAFGETLALREIIDDGSIAREWTYAELHNDAHKLARALAARHPHDARIAIYANNSPEWILLELASALAGLVLVTVNPAFNARELRYVLEQSGAEAIYYVEAVRGRALGPVIDEACAELAQVTHRIRITDHAHMFNGSEGGELPDTAPDDVVQIQYTSGTTGFPKGALLHQKGLIQNASDLFDRFGAESGDSYILMTPLFHTAGCAAGVCGCLAHGVTMLVAPGYDQKMIAEVIERERPELVLGVPTMLFGLVEEAEKNGRDLTSAKAVMCGGAMVAPELARRVNRYFEAPIQIIYGQTESSPCITGSWRDDSHADSTETIGQAFPHTDVAIFAPGTRNACAIGEQGEICARGYQIMTGYNDNPEATAAAIDEEGWLRTGDLGTMDERGYVKITGRVKEMIIRGGENLFPAEIENAMLEHPALSQVAVAGVPDDRMGELVACFMAQSAGTERPSPAELKAFIRERLSPQKTPAYWIWVDEWPMTGSGKIQKFELANRFVAGEYAVLTA